MIDLSYIRPAVSVEDIKAELTRERFVRNTSKLNNEIYIVNVHNAPQTVQEVGRLRELTLQAQMEARAILLTLMNLISV